MIGDVAELGGGKLVERFLLGFGYMHLLEMGDDLILGHAVSNHEPFD